MTERVKRLRDESLKIKPSISSERAELLTEFYREHDGQYSVPVMRARAFAYLCERKTIYIGHDELIVGERGPSPKAVSTFPELTCHSAEDLRVLRSREKTSYDVADDVIKAYEERVIPYWRGRSMRDRIFAQICTQWQSCYNAGIFTEFMEQRAPGHPSLDGKLYGKGLLDFKTDIERNLRGLDFLNDLDATEKQEELEAMAIACDAAVVFAERHADLAARMAEKEESERRRPELLSIERVCRRVPAHAPRNLHEALQAYWFVHLGTITELNGWDAMNPGHLDQHLEPFYERELAVGSLSREQAKELIECFWVKVNNQPAPPKVGVTAEESSTYNDFTNINLGGLRADGSDGVSDLSYLILEIIDEMHLLQPGSNIQLSRKNPDRFLKSACRVIGKGYGYPSVFNADAVIAEMLRAGKTLEDARQGGTSGCVETGCFGKEAYILTGYFNTPKILEITLNNGVDPRTGEAIGLPTGDARNLVTFEELYDAFVGQLRHFIDIKIRGNQYVERMYAAYAPAPFLSVLIEDCIERGKDYNAGGARYNTAYIQCVGIGTITDSLSAIRKHVYDDKSLTMDELLAVLAGDFDGSDAVRSLLSLQTPRYGNDDDYADRIMLRVFQSLFEAIDGRPNTRGGRYHMDMLPTTCHIYFGSVTGATPDGRRAGKPLSEGISPVQGADRKGPTAVLKSAAKMDHLKTGGTLLNQKLLPGLLATEDGINNLASLVRTFFQFDAHHIQFNVIDSATLRKAQEQPEQYRNLLVRVAGYSDYFCDLGRELQDEIISRTEQKAI